MNLRDKLKAISKPKAPESPAPVPTFTSCWSTTLHYPLTNFPDTPHIHHAPVMLMQGDPMPSPLDPCRILYLDTETTGLGGGAGTVAFEVGLGWLTEEGFTVKQLIMRDYPEEKYLLEEIIRIAEGFDVICTFNGKTFDLPLLKNRFIMNRIRTESLDKPHIDLLHIARRVFKLRLKQCRLVNLEEALLGLPREDDLPGALVPERFFSYLKTGDFTLFDDVLRHNAQDIASLCTLLGHMCRMYEEPESMVHEEDVYSMGVALERFRHREEARRCYRLAGGRMHAESQLRLAASLKRDGLKEEAAAIWQEMIRRKEGGVAPYVELAKYYEHTARDAASALDVVRRAIAVLAEPTLFDPPSVQEERNALQYRYERLLRKAGEP